MATTNSPIAGNTQVYVSSVANVRVRQPFDERISALTANLYQADGTEVDTGLTTAVGRTITLSAAAGTSQTDPTKMTLTDDSGQAKTDFWRLCECVIGLPDYSARGYRERFVVAHYEYDADGTCDLYSMRDLTHDYATADSITVWNCYHTVSLTTTHTATVDRNYRLQLTWTLDDGTSLITDVYLDIVKRPMIRTLSAEAVERIAPGTLDTLMEYTDAAGGTVDESMDAGWQRVIRDVQGRGFEPDLIRNQEQLEEPTAWAVRLLLAEMGAVPVAYRDSATGYLDHCQYRYAESITRMMNNLKFYDENDDLAVGSGEEGAPIGRAVWLER